MRIIRNLLPAACLLVLANSTQAQSYKTAAGIRVDNGVQLTVQQHIVNSWTAEGILHTSIGSENLGLTLLAEKHSKILFRSTNIYFGAGGHYYWDNESSSTEPASGGNNVYGLSFIGGAEISLGRVNVAVDWKPELHLSQSDKTFGWNGASVSVRYIFAKRERKKFKDLFGGGNKKRNSKYR